MHASHGLWRRRRAGGPTWSVRTAACMLHRSITLNTHACKAGGLSLSWSPTQHRKLPLLSLASLIELIPDRNAYAGTCVRLHRQVRWPLPCCGVAHGACRRMRTRCRWTSTATEQRSLASLTVMQASAPRSEASCGRHRFSVFSARCSRRLPRCTAVPKLCTHHTFALLAPSGRCSGQKYRLGSPLPCVHAQSGLHALHCRQGGVHLLRAACGGWGKPL